MIGKRFLLPWEKKYNVECPQCGGKIKTSPIWYWQKQDDKLGELQRLFCHAIDSDFLEKIPVLTENDWKSSQKWDAFLNDIKNGYGLTKTSEGPHILTVKNGLPQIFWKHGVFALIGFLTETELKVLFLFLCLDPAYCAKPVWIRQTMEISTSYVSTVLNKLTKWRLMTVKKGAGKGRARGRQLVYSVADDARRILEQDLQNHDFFREAVVQTVAPIAERFPAYPWRKDLVKADE